ncbi:hypothetical protein QUA62_17740 [Microcoleus sp. MON1_C1]|uniref:hypothetical protein n=1 Tax=Microcoleus sp. MON1_C1 TaxID=2818827 RepID=UPI002FD3FD5D
MLRVQLSFLASQSPHKVEGFFLGKMRAMQSFIELDLPESLANEIGESVRPEYLKLWRRIQPRRE